MIIACYSGKCYVTIYKIEMLLKGEENMTDKITGVSSEARRKRINRLKKMIIATIIVGISLPLIICVFLLLRMNRLEKLVKEMTLVVETELSQVDLPDESDSATDNVNVPSNFEEPRTDKDNNIPEDDLAVKDMSVESTGTDEYSKGEDKDIAVEAMSGERYGDTEADEDDVINVYLTFDDGPSIYTEEILAVLDAYGVKATFFVLAKDNSVYDEAYRAIVENGHTLGMHSYTHVYEEIYSGLPAFMKDVTSVQNFLYEKTGVLTNLYRFPGGSSNSYCKKTIQDYITYLDDAGIVYFDWNISSQDATGEILTKEQIAENVLSKIDKYRDCVVLMHDAASKKTTVEALPLIIEGINAMGNTRIIPIDENTKAIQHRTKK